MFRCIKLEDTALVRGAVILILCFQYQLKERSLRKNSQAQGVDPDLSRIE